MNLGTFEIIILIMLAMAVILPICYWGIPWFCKKVSDLTRTAESPERSLFKRLCVRIGRTLVAIFIVLGGILASSFMAFWKLVKSLWRFFIHDYEPDPPADKPIKPRTT